MIGGITGGVASGATQSLNNVVGGLSSNMGRVALQTTKGAFVSGTTGALGAVLNNIMYMKAIDEEQFISYLKSCGADLITAEQIWDDLVLKGYILNNMFTQQCENGINLSKNLIDY